MRRLAAFLALTVLLTIALPALANHAEDLTLDCEGWSVTFLEFNNLDHELLVTVNGLEVFYAENPPDGDFILSGPLPEGLDGSVTLATFWRHRQKQIEGPTLTVELNCTPEEVTTTTQPEVTTTQPPAVTTTTTVQECADGLIHQPPFCVPPTDTPTTTVADSTTTTALTVLPFTGDSTSLLALAASLFLTLGLATLMFVKREPR